MASDAPRPERLFIGVPVSADARDAIARALPKNLPGKPVAPDKWHFTLRFLGATESETRDKIVAGLSSTPLGSEFQVRFGQLGAFPNSRRARILWLGLTKGGERLCELAATAEDVARSAGFPAEGRAFKPHLTLSRIDPPVSVTALLEQHHRYDFAMTVTAVILYRSRLGGGPARYEEVARFAL
ncbi:MAG TPA: RNA 2',3'-cyclic phosphodiesterase [Gemmatimonadaceae bacterium]|nr:RNA 2',3'-cyclic phosphodiesterase [Gemmatimonadaceae bacterium]